MKERFIEFFENDKKHLSMPRLLHFLAFFVASYKILASPIDAVIFNAYLATYAVTYLGGKGLDKFRNKTKG